MESAKPSPSPLPHRTEQAAEGPLPTVRPGRPKQECRRALVFRYGQIGDTIVALPALWAIRHSLPAAHLTLLSDAPLSGRHLGPEQVLPPTALIDEFARYELPAGSGSLRSIFRSIREIRAGRYDTLFYLAPSGRSPARRRRDLVFFRLAGISRFIAHRGFNTPEPRAPGRPLPPVEHEADALLRRLELAGLAVPPPGKGCMDLRITSQERLQASEWWRRTAGAPPARSTWFATGVGGKAPSQIWPLEYYKAVGRTLIDQFDLTPVIFGGTEDAAAAGGLIAAWGRGYCAAGSLSVRQAAAAMSDALFYLGNDTGTMHLAAAAGVPCVAIFSARNEPGRWHPYGAGHHVLRLSPPCEACERQVCNRNLECLRGISPETVFQCCAAVVRAARANPGGRRTPPPAAAPAP
jgi:ADP-heptose:LPS heptosyltransferase